MRYRIYFFLFLILSFSSCHPNRIYDKNTDLEGSVWNKEQLYQFNFDIEDTSLGYNLFLNLRNGLSYPYRNIYVEIEIEDEEGNSVFKELKNFELFDSKTGKPYGSGLGDLFDHRLPILENFKFENPGKYTVRYEQFMRVEELPFIVSVGLMVEKYSTK